LIGVVILALKEEYGQELHQWTSSWVWQIPKSIKTNLDLVCKDSGAMGESLASLASDKKGMASGGSGFDLTDGKTADEVKFASWIQSSTCKNCKEKVLFWNSQCEKCGSVDLKINADSRWCIDATAAVKYKDKLENYHLKLVEPQEYIPSCRTFIFSYFVIKSSNKYFGEYTLNQYHNSADSNNCNLLPYSYDFYMCDPVKKLTATIIVGEEDVKVGMNYFDLNNEITENMDVNKLKGKELKILLDSEGVEYKPNLNRDGLKKLVIDKFSTKIPKESLFLRNKSLNKDRGKTSRHL